MYDFTVGSGSTGFKNNKEKEKSGGGTPVRGPKVKRICT